VVNTTTHPVPITRTVAVAENPARQAVQQQLKPIAGAGSITVPAGKIFVLEFVSFRFLDGGGGTLEEIGISVTDPLITGGQGSASYYLGVPPTSSNTSYTGGQALRLYAQPGTTLSVIWTVGNASFPDLTVSLSGYFVNAQ